MAVDDVLNRLTLAFGVLFVAVGLALVFVDDPFPFGVEVIFVAGLFALLFTVLTVRHRLQSETSQTETPDPEVPAATARAGDDVDRMLHEMTALRQGITENREHLEERLETLAVEVVRDREDCSSAQAREILAAGSWTDDEDAADFFRNERSAAEEAGLADLLGGGHSEVEDFERRFRAAVEKLLAYGEIDVSPRSAETESPGLRERLLGGAADGDETDRTASWNAADSSIGSFDTDERLENVSLHRTNRWLGVTAFGLLAIGVGVVAFSPLLMLAGVVGIGYTIYGRVAAVPMVEALEIERELEEPDPDPGEELAVTVTIRNEGDSMFPDLRFVDVVPDAFVVTDGVPRLHTALRAGSSATFEYTVRVERGEYEWPLLCIARDFSGGAERTTLLTPEAELTCVPSLSVTDDVPVRAQTTKYSGEVDTETGGAGLEFHSVRDYLPGDPVNRIDWKQLARTGDLATIDYRQERAATVTLLFDTRQRAYVSSDRGEPHAVDRAVHAASDVFGSLYEGGNLVGIAAFDTVPCWFPAGAGSEHREHARLVFAQHPALSPRPPERQDVDGGYVDPMTHVLRRLESNSQIFLFTPLADDYAAEVASRLDSEGHLVTVISPDVTTDETVGQRLTRAERTTRVRWLRGRNIRVIDWEPEESLRLQIDRAKARWAR